MPAPLQGQPSNSLVLPQDLLDVLHDLLVALGLHVHEHLLPRIWSRKGRKGGRGLRGPQDPAQSPLVLHGGVRSVQISSSKAGVYITHNAAFFRFCSCEHR